MTLATLQDSYVDELNDLYNAAHELLKVLPKVAKALSTPEVAKAFTDHLEETKSKIERLEKIFNKLDVSPRDADPTVMDAAFIASAQRVEDYEMAGYGCAQTVARSIGDERAAGLDVDNDGK